MPNLFVEIPTFCGSEGAVDFETLEKHLAWVWARGVSRSSSTSPTSAASMDRAGAAPRKSFARGAILMSRPVGESQHFSVQERESYLRHAVGVLKGRTSKICVISEITSTSSRLCLENCRLAKSTGCDYALVRAPPKPELMDQQVWQDACVVELFKDVASASCLPLILVCDDSVNKDAALALAKNHNNIAGILANQQLVWVESGEQDIVSVLANIAPIYVVTIPPEQLAKDEHHIVAKYGVGQLKHCLKSLRGYQKCEPASRQLAAAMRDVTDVPPVVEAYFRAELALRN